MSESQNQGFLLSDSSLKGEVNDFTPLSAACEFLNSVLILLVISAARIITLAEWPWSWFIIQLGNYSQVKTTFWIATGITHAITSDVLTLRRLNLSLCKQITDSSLGRLAQHLRHLHELDLGGCCNVTNTGLLLIAWGLKQLKSLNLRSCWHISDQGIASLAGLNSNAGGNLALEHLGLQVEKQIPHHPTQTLNIGALILFRYDSQLVGRGGREGGGDYSPAHMSW